MRWRCHKRVVGLIPGAWVPSKCSHFLPQSKDAHINLISNSKLTVHVNVSLLVIFLLVVLWQTWQPVQSFCGPSPRDSCDWLLHLCGCPSWSCGGKKNNLSWSCFRNCPVTSSCCWSTRGKLIFKWLSTSTDTISQSRRRRRNQVLAGSFQIAW